MTEMKPIKVMLVDDHEVVREVIAAQLSREADMVVVGMAADGEACIREALICRPDVVLMDVDMPGLSPFAAVGTLLSRLPEVRVIFLTAFSHDLYIEQAIHAKAWGYITKSEPFSTIRQAIRDVAEGSVHFSPEIKERIVDSPEGSTPAPEGPTRRSKLTQREIEVLQYLAKGLSTKDIARTMHISTKTVENHKSHLMTKLGIHDRVELTRYAFREGFTNL